MTIQNLKELKERVTNAPALEAIDLAIKYKELKNNLEYIRDTKKKLINEKVFKRRATKSKLNIEIGLLDQLIKHLD